MSAANGTSSESTSSSLLNAVRARDADAWLRLSKLYGPEVYGWARGAGLQDEDAADIVQEAFRAIANNIARFRKTQPGDSFRGWVWTITRNCIRQFIRERAVRPGAVGGTDAYVQFQHLPDDPRDASATKDGPAKSSGLARRALDLISTDFEERTWTAFVQTVMDGRKPTDVAADLGMSVASVYTAKSRVLARLRDEFQDLIEGC